MSAATWELPDYGVDVAPALPVRRPRLTLVSVGVDRPVSRGALRITRAGRLAITTAVALAIVSSLVWMLIAPRPVPTHEVTVQPGQSLSEIAAVQLPNLSVRQGVAQIMSASNLSTDQISAGQVINVPTR